MASTRNVSIARACILSTVALVIALAARPATAVPDPTPDPNAAVVLLRTDCGPSGSQLENCFETMASLADTTTGWIWATRNPSASAPLLVDVGPGQFGSFDCNGGSHVSVKGAGREHTILRSTFAVDVVDCDQLAFIDIGLHGERYAINWIGLGEASWSNVDALGLGLDGIATVAWNDAGCLPGTKSLHYFHGSRLRTVGARPVIVSVFFSSCAETWFFGGEIFMNLTGTTNYAHTLHLFGEADFRAFGTAIRTRLDPAGVVNIGSMVGIQTQSNATFHAHGSIINTSANLGAGDVDAVGVRNAGLGLIHTPGTAFVVKAAGNGEAIRVEGSGPTESPFFWFAKNDPPAGPTSALRSSNGQDIFVETDCDSSGNCNGAGNETHLMVYNDQLCASTNPWFDTVTGACRP